MKEQLNFVKNLDVTLEVKFLPCLVITRMMIRIELMKGMPIKLGCVSQKTFGENAEEDATAERLEASVSIAKM